MLVFVCVKGAARRAKATVCPKCKKNFPTHDDMIQHRRRCWKRQVLQCGHCPYRTNQKGNLSKHVQVKHLELEPADCPKCGRTFKNLPSMLGHSNYCMVERNLECHECGYKTNKRYVLTKHIKLSHYQLFTDQVLKCQICGKQLTNIFSFEEHVKQCRDKEACVAST